METTIDAAQKKLAEINELLLTGEKNPRGIPATMFIEDVESFIAKHSLVPDDLFNSFQILHHKYKFMEQHQMKNKVNIKAKIPDIARTLQSVQYLVKKRDNEEDVTSHFSLCDNVYAKAKLTNPDNIVCLWLGANVMLEYTYEEAVALLSENLRSAEQKLIEIQEDIDFLRDHVITTEVNIARTYNYEIKKRKAEIEANSESKEVA